MNRINDFFQRRIARCRAQGPVKCLVKTALWGGLGYVLFFTIIGITLIEFMLGLVYSTIYFNTEENARPPFRIYLHEQPVFRAVCDLTNAIASITQPIVSDKAMIAHWEKHHLEWEEAIAMIDRGEKPKDYQVFKRHLASIGLASISYDGHFKDSKEDNERRAILIPDDSIGIHQRPYACTGRGGSSKTYEFYPDKTLVRIDGYAYRPHDVAKPGFQSKQKEIGIYRRPLVEDADHLRYYIWALRPLNERWFIERNH